MMCLCLAKNDNRKLKNNPENRQTMAASRWRFKSTN